MSLYFDYASATPVDPRVLEAMQPYFSDHFANPSSLYKMGRVARDGIEKARAQVAKAIGARADEIVFTSGGTEANNLAIIGAALAREAQSKRIVTSLIEHQAVLQPCKWLKSRGWDVSYLPVNEHGLISDQALKVVAGDISVCSIMLANNEIGTIQPLTKLFQSARKLHAYTHTDACQALGNIPVNVRDLQADLLTLNSGKVYGPKGCGALYIRSGVEIASLAYGGKQEFGHRAGTENVPAIVGFGLASELAVEKLEVESKRLRELQEDLLQQLLTIPGAVLNGDRVQRLANNINVSFEGVEPEALLFYLDEAGIMVSSGSACAQASMSASHVLLAIGRDIELAQQSVRITLGRDTAREDVATLATTLKQLVQKLRTV